MEHLHGFFKYFLTLILLSQYITSVRYHGDSAFRAQALDERCARSLV